MHELTLYTGEVFAIFSVLIGVLISIVVIVRQWYKVLGKQWRSDPISFNMKSQRTKLEALDIFKQSRSIWFLSLNSSLAIALAIFAWTQDLESYSADSACYTLDPIEEIEIIRTKYKKPPKLAPPKIETISMEDLIPEEPKFESMDMAIDLEAEIDANIDQSQEDYSDLIPISVPDAVQAPVPMKEEDMAEDIVHIYTDEMPRFSGCEDQDLGKEALKACAEGEMLSYIHRNLKYPVIARENCIQGTVVIQFVIDEQGDIFNARIARDVAGGCGVAAMQVVKSMPKWIPGRQIGKKVKVQFTLPIVFKLDCG